MRVEGEKRGTGIFNEKHLMERSNYRFRLPETFQKLTGSKGEAISEREIPSHTFWGYTLAVLPIRARSIHRSKINKLDLISLSS